MKETTKEDRNTSNPSKQNNEQFIKAIIDSLPSMIGYWDRDLYCHFANNAYIK